MNKKLIIPFILIFIVIPLIFAGNDSSVFDVSAYKVKNYTTEGYIKVWVKEWVSKNTGTDVNGIGLTSIQITEDKVGKNNFDLFSVFVESNLQNTIRVTVDFGNFVNPRFGNVALKPDYFTWLKYDGKEYAKGTSLPTFDSGAVWETKNDYYKYRYYPVVEYSGAGSFDFYYEYEKQPCNSNGKLDNNVSFTGYSTKFACSDLQVLPGIAPNTKHKAEVVYRWIIDPEKYQSLPEGVEFVSTVTINIGVE